jgi:hypothetical protein
MAHSNRGKPRYTKSVHQAHDAKGAPHAALRKRQTAGAGAELGNDALEPIHEKPRLNDFERELTFLGRLIKRFRQQADVQELVFKAFQKHRWCKCIANPLPRREGRNRKHYLHHTIQNLNAHQHFPGIEFFADGTGQHLCWRPTTKARRRATALLRRENC